MEFQVFMATLIFAVLAHLAKTDAQCGDPPSVQYASHNGTLTLSFHDGDVILYNCYAGFSALGSLLYECRNDNWVGDLTCQRLNCNVPDVPNLIFPLSADWSVGSSMTVTCSPGYRLIGPRHLVCLVSQQWDPYEPHCERVTCEQLPALQNGRRFQDTLLHGSNSYGNVVENTCNHGYRLVGSPRQRCLEDGNWSGPPAHCEEIICGEPDVGLSNIAFISGTRLGDYASISCPNGTRYIGASFGGLQEIICTEDGWDGGQCLADCAVELIEDGQMADQEPVLHGEQLTWTCNSGSMKVRLQEQVYCVNGTFLPPPTCEPVNFGVDPMCIEPRYNDLSTRRGDTCYYFLEETTSSKGSAVDLCRRRYHGELVKIPDADTMDYLTSLLNAASWAENDVWLGIHWKNNQWQQDTDAEDDHIGAPLEYSNWIDGEGGATNLLLMQYKHQKCAVLKRSKSWRWNDVKCSISFSSKNIICQGSTLVQEQYQ